MVFLEEKYFDQNCDNHDDNDDEGKDDINDSKGSSLSGPLYDV